jgi:3-Ketosteroid 9alpha-hydroxylase C-terminal domain
VPTWVSADGWTTAASWENERYQPTPALAPTERPVTEFRRWAAQFYAEMAAPVGG